jgi:D-amino-acid oxidase
MNIAIIGCGVAGLTSGLRLLEQGFSVTILARDLPPRTTSDVAAAFWAPGSITASARLYAWSRASYEAFQELAEIPGSGITFKRLVELFDEPIPLPTEPAWIEDRQPVEPGRFPAPIQGGYQLTVPAIDTPLYMPFLVQRFRERGGIIHQTEITDLAGLLTEYPLLVNCPGVWAGELTGDRWVYPIRGQVVRVRKPAGLPPEILHYATASAVTYIVPRSGDCLLGGTYQDGNWSREPDMATAQAIIERCAWLNPALREPDIIEHKVGLRPGRPGVRLELERVSATTAIIHNYGHGAIGHTLSWGCAGEVARLAVKFREEVG